MRSGEGQWDVGHVYLFIFASKEVQAWDKISHDRFEMRSLQCWGELISVWSQLSWDAAARAHPGPRCLVAKLTFVSQISISLCHQDLAWRQLNSRQVVGEG